MGIEEFGVHLKRLLVDPASDCSASCLASALDFAYPATVYRWMRGEKTPALSTDYVERIIEHLKLSPTEALELRNAQVRSLRDRGPRPPKRRRPAKRSAPVAPLLERWGQHTPTGVGESYDRATQQTAQGAEILSRIIDLFESLPDAAGRTDDDRTIVLTWQSRDTTDMSAALEERWLGAIQAILRRGWRMLYLCRLDRNIHRTVRLVELMRDLVGTGAYFPRYFTTYGTLTPPYDLVIIPGVAGVALFSGSTAHSVDAGIITRDADHIQILQAHARQLAQHTTPLVTAYFGPDDDLGYSQRLRDAEEHSGGRSVIKDGLSVITHPEAWYTEPSTASAPDALASESWAQVARYRKQRIAAFKRFVGAYDYYDICTERAIKELVQRGAYPDSDLSNGPHQGRASCLEHLRNTVDLLRTYDRYHLALVSEYQATDPGPNGIPTTVKWQVTGNNSVFMGISIPNNTGRLAPANLHITEPTVAEGFREHFHQTWERIPPINREKEHVIEWLERQISELECVMAQAAD